MLFDVGRASGTKLCRLLWNMNLVEIELLSLCLPWSSVKRQHWYRGVPLQRLLVFPCTRSCYTTAKWRDVLEREQFSSRLWPYQGMKHTVSQNGEFISRYC